LYIRSLNELFVANSKIYWFDECTFEVHRKSAKAFEYIGKKPIIKTKMTPISVRVLMICSMTSVECLMMTVESSLGTTVYSFIKEFFVRKLAENPQSNDRIFLVLDNAKKNRGDQLKKLADCPRVHLVYIIPNTPALNYIENLFNVIKRRVYANEFKERYV
jgi:hypothetical protein